MYINYILIYILIILLIFILPIVFQYIDLKIIKDQLTKFMPSSITENMTSNELHEIIIELKKTESTDFNLINSFISFLTPDILKIKYFSDNKKLH